MKSAPWIAATLIAAGAFAARAQEAGPSADARQQIQRLERDWAGAIVRRDADALDRVLADDYVLTTPEGLRVPRARIVESFRAPRATPYTIRDAEVDEVDVRLYGETAVVSSRFTLASRTSPGLRGRDIETHYRHTDVFVKQGGRWRAVTRQATRIVESYDPHDDRAPAPGGSLRHDPHDGRPHPHAERSRPAPVGGVAGRVAVADLLPP